MQTRQFARRMSDYGRSQTAMFAFFDGPVRLISRDVDQSLLRSLGLPNDGGPTGNTEAAQSRKRV